MTDTAAVLDAIDEALADDRAEATDPDLRELQGLALALRADAPRPHGGFAAHLDAQVAAGFPRRRRLPSLPALGRLPRPAVAVAASALLAVAVAAGLLAQGGNDPRPDAAVEAPESAPGAGGAAAPAPGSAFTLEDDTGTGDDLLRAQRGGPIAPGERTRRIARDAQLTIGAPADELPRVGDEVIAITDRHRGFVPSSSLTTGDEGASGGAYELRIPQERLRAAIRDLSALGTVESRSEQGEDITPAFSRNEERLAEARSERRGLLRRLEAAQTGQEAAAIRGRLRLVSAEIRRLERRLASLGELVDYAAVSVTLTEREDGNEGGAGTGGTGEALDDALGSLEGALNLTVRALGVALPLALLGAAAWLGVAILRRRRREAALG